jgi:hypothetical protein
MKNLDCCSYLVVQNRTLFLVAGAGFEPTTSGL